MERKIRTYESDEIEVEYDVRRCIHAAECVKGLPAVFDPASRPWIDPTKAASAEEVARVVERCPTGALHYRLKADGPAEVPDPQNTARIAADGPLYLRGRLRLRLGENTLEETRAALCRCGQSKDKPFCDNSHVEAGFKHDGRVAENKLRSDDDAPTTAEVEPVTNGPLRVSGRIAVEAADGSRCEGTGGVFCRCGQSSSKPFCDGTHRKVGFSS